MKIRRNALLRCLPALLLPTLAFPAVHGLAQTSAATGTTTSPKPAQPSRVTPRLARVGRTAISPDGELVAWTLGGREGTTLHLTSFDHPDASKERLVAPAEAATGCGNSDPVWSPDAKVLAFTSTCTGKTDEAGQAQVFVWDRATGAVRQLTHVKGLFEQAAWSPDGKTLAFLFVENATRHAGALAAMKPFAGVIGKDNIEIQGVYGVDVASGKGDWLVPATPQMYTFEFAWAPDSKSLATISSKAPGENNWWVAELYSVTPGGEAQAVLDPNTTTTALHGLQIAVPRWSPDGKRIAVIGGLMSDQGSTGGDVWVVEAKANSQPVDVTPGIDGTPVYETWYSNDGLGFVENRREHSVLVGWNVDAKKQTEAVDLGEVSVGGGPVKDAVSSTAKGRLAFVSSSLTSGPEVMVAGGGKVRPLTHLNDGVKATGRTESEEWTNGGFHVQGWLTFPKDYDAAKKYPILVMVHGGPSADIGPRFDMGSEWAENGYFLFQPNPRGSFGQGEAFTAANRKDFGYGDLDDILAGMDAVEAKIPAIDKNREGLTGWSYGGFMSMFAPTRTKRFKAIVAGAGLSDWESYYGENSIGEWMIPFFGASVYDDPAVYAKSSAINRIKQVAPTPMLIIVGDRDGECPMPQSLEMWNGLKAMGVKTELVVYPDEGHGFQNPAHIRDRAKRTLDWFADNMK